MKRLILCAALLLGACTTQARFTGIADACDVYAASLESLAALNTAGKLSLAQIATVDLVRIGANAVCSGAAPATDYAAFQKVTGATLAILQIQKGTAP